MGKKPKTAKEYEELGRVVAAIYDTGYIDAKQSYKNSFIKGIFSGFGGVIGATIVVAILIWLLSFFNSLPLIGPFVDTIRHTVQR